MTITRLELPAVYLDEVVLDSLNLSAGADYLEVLNRNPEPDEEGVRADTLITFDIAGSNGNPPILANTRIDIRVTSALGFLGPTVIMYDGTALLKHQP